MSASASKSHKRTDVYLELRKARQAASRAADQLISAGEALKELSKALCHIKNAGQAAQASRLEWQEEGQPQSKTKRDALPAGIRRGIAREQVRIEELMARVKAIPVTKDQAAIAKAQKARRKK